MTINAAQFGAEIVTPALQLLEAAAGIPNSPTAFNLVMGTIAQESLLGTFLVQQGGSALGICQIEPSTLTSLVASLSTKEAAALAMMALPGAPAQSVVASLPYAVALVRLYYWRVPAPLPANTVTALFDYYKQYYNTAAGAATLVEWRQNWLLTGISLPLS